jgi:hypothetical protein
MAFGAELKAFVSSFKSGWDMVADAQKDKENSAIKREEMELRRAANARGDQELAEKLKYYGTRNEGQALENQIKKQKIDGTYKYSGRGTSGALNMEDFAPEDSEEDFSPDIGAYHEGGAVEQLPAPGATPATPTVPLDPAAPRDGSFGQMPGHMQPQMQGRGRMGYQPMSYMDQYRQTHGFSGGMPQQQWGQAWRGPLPKNAVFMADGGAVPEEDELPNDTPKGALAPYSTAGYLGGEAQGGRGGYSEHAKSQRDTVVPGITTSAPTPEDTKPKINWDAVHEATGVGMEALAKNYGLLDEVGVETPEKTKGVQSFAEGSSENDKIRREAEALIDPKGNMSPGTRTAATMANIFEHFMGKGQPDKAAKAAAAVLESVKKETQTLFAISQAAAEEGDIGGAAKAWIRAYSGIPDGLEITARQLPDGNLAIRRIDEQTGLVKDEMVMSPEDQFKIVTNQELSNFDAIVMAAANEREAKKNGGAGGTESVGTAGALPTDSPVTSGVTPPKKPSDTKNSMEMVNTAWADMYGEQKSGMTKPEEVKVKGIARRLTEEQQMDAGEALVATQAILYVDPANPTAVGFEVTPDYKKTGVVMVDGKQVKFAPEQLKQLFAMRDAFVAKAEKAAAEGEKGWGATASRVANRELRPTTKRALARAGQGAANSTAGRVVKGAADVASKVGAAATDAVLGNNPAVNDKVQAVQDWWGSWNKGE